MLLEVQTSNTLRNMFKAYTLRVCENSTCLPISHMKLDPVNSNPLGSLCCLCKHSSFHPSEALIPFFICSPPHIARYSVQSPKHSSSKKVLHLR